MNQERKTRVLRKMKRGIGVLLACSMMLVLLPSTVFAVTPKLAESNAQDIYGTVWSWSFWDSWEDGMSQPPIQVPSLNNVAAIARDAVLMNDGTVWVFGWTINHGHSGSSANSSGVSTTFSGAVQVSNLSNVIAIDNSTALKDDGTVWAFSPSAILSGGVPARQIPNLNNVAAISSGTALMSDGTVWQWPRLDTGGTAVQVQNLNNVVEIAGMTALKSDGTVWAWGFHSLLSPQAGLPLEPQQISNLSNVAAISRSAALKSDGTVWQFRVGVDVQNEAIHISSLSDIVAIAGTTVLGSDGYVWTWVPNAETIVPQRVIGPNGVGFLNLGTTVSQAPVSQAPVSQASVSQASAPQVQQTAPSAWAAPFVEQAVSANLVPQGLQPDYTTSTTRAEFAALAVALYEAVTGGTIAGRASFNDTSDVNVQKMGYLGVVTGVGNGNFNPNGQLTREQAAVMLARLADAIGQPLPQSSATFADSAQVSAWAADAVGQVQAAGIMGGVGNNRFAPSGDYTREQSIVTMLRLFELLN